MLTKEKDLRTGRSIWEDYIVPDIPCMRLEGSQTVDAVVIGAGISGAMVAEELSQAGLSVAMLDRRGAIKGSTLASTALLIYEIDMPFIRLEEKIGHDKAARVWRRCKLGLESLAAKIQNIGIECAMERVNSLYLTGTMMDTASLRKERDKRNLIGLPTEYLSQKQLKERYGISRRGALLTTDCIAVNPAQMTAGFLKSAFEKGVRLYAPVTAENIIKQKTGYTIETDTGNSIIAKYVIYATGYEIPNEIHTRRHSIQSTWVIATKKQPENLWPEHPFIWEASEPYLYIRATSDGRILCGGEDEPFSDQTARDALLEKKTAILERKLGKLLPHLDTNAEFAWTGSFGASTTGLPSIGEIPGMKNVYAIMAYGGNGINFSRVAAELITASILGKPDPDEGLFAFPD